MKIQIIPPENQPVAQWSGGQTRELYIAGGAADYAARDFTLRLSSATVETDESTFTPLPAFHRVLMPLSAPVQLTHDEEQPIALLPFQTDFFDGGAKTISRGRCQDFNVMWAKDAPFEVALEALDNFPCLLDGAEEDFYYAYRGDFFLDTRHENIHLMEGSLLHLGRPGITRIRQGRTDDAQLIHAAVQRK